MAGDFKGLEELSPNKRRLFELLLKERRNRVSQQSKIPRRRDTGAAPLSFAQQRLWFFDQLKPNSPLYNLPLALRLSGALNIDALKRTLTEIGRRHEILRTTFALRGDQPAQIIGPPEEFALPLIDLSGRGEATREAQARLLSREEVQRPFDLARGPLWRATLLRLGKDEYLMLFTMHHIVSDGWSMSVLVREICQIYEAMSEGRPAPLPEPEIQYADYAEWQRSHVAGGVLEKEVGYWKERLNGAAIMELSTDYPRPAIPSYRGGHERFEIDAEASDGLKRLGQREGATLYMVLMAAFKALLMRYSGEVDLSVGTVIANRTRRELEELIGFFVNTLVMRTDLGGNPSFRELVGREREVALGAYARQGVPFEKLVEEINPERDLSRNPLFQSLMALQNTGQNELDLRGLKVREIVSEAGAAKFDLTLVFTEERGIIEGSLEYSRDLYEGETIRRMAGHYKRLVAEIVRDADQRIREIELLSEAEKRQLTVEWNETQRACGETGLAHEMIAEQARRRADAIAVRSEQGALSYRELEQRANRLGRYLVRHGVEREALVGICADRSAEMVVLMLGVLKAGAAYLPIDASYPEERVRYMLEDAGVKIVLKQGAAGQRLEEMGLAADLIDLEGCWGQIMTERADRPEVMVEGENLAYVIYTSGSTGRPKGVSIRHHSLANSTRARFDHYHEPVSSFLLVSPFGFDSSVAGVYWTLCQGGALVLPYESLERDPSQLARLMAENGVSHLLCLPTLYSLLLMEAAPRRMDSLRCVILAGEACPPEVVDRHSDLLPGVDLFNEYGPTEGTVWSSVYGDCSRLSRRPTPIGKPIPNTQIYILDQELEPVPRGVKGEIYISGMGLARGYIGKPELTGEKFIPNQFSRNEGARAYRTGDIGRYLSDGNIEFIGRTDDQVKIRGYRIELGEIEAALNEHPSVKQSVVVVKEDQRVGKRLVGYVVGEEGTDAATLKMYVRERLPEYMVPEAILVLEELPLTVNGKIDRKRLPAPVEGRQPRGEAVIAPRDGLEFQLVKIWESVLGLQPIGIRDNFFDLGGHSLLAASLMVRIRKMAGRDLPLSTLFQGGTIERLAAILRRDASSMSVSCLVEIQQCGPSSGSLLPLFFVHPADGTVLCYAELARCLGSDQPFYALQTPGLYGERPLYTSIEELAAHYIEALRTVQPAGPYLLGGWSLGGIIAYEMAQQLVRQGQRTAQLLLLDTTARPPQTEQTEEDDAALLIDWFSEHLALPREDLQQFHGDQLIDHALKRAIGANLLPPDIEAAQIRSHLRAHRANLNAMHKYIPQPYSGAVTLFKASEQAYRPPSGESAGQLRLPKSAQDPTLGWGALAAGGVRIVEVPGQHATMMSRPHVETLAKRIGACLGEARITTSTE